MQNQNPAPHSGYINEFLWLCAGVDRRVLRQCPADQAKYAGIGGTILFTALMAMCSGGYALNFVFGDPALSIPFGIFWGCLIFNLDRFIVNTMYSDGKVTISWQEVKSGLPRIVLAVFLGIVISFPLELKMFDDEIQVKIEEMKKERLADYVKKDQAKLDALQKKIEEVQNTPIRDIVIKGGNEKLNSLDQQRKDVQAEADKERAAIANLVQRRRQLQAANHDGKNDRAIATVNGQISSHQRALNACNAQISNIQGQMAAIDAQVMDAIITAQKEKQKTLDILREEEKALNEKIANAQTTYNDVLEQNFHGLQAQMHAFNEMKKEDAGTHTASLLVMMLFIIIEIVPTVFRMMMEDGPYDDMVRAERHRVRTLADTHIAETDNECGTDLKINVQKNADRLAAELKANNDVIACVAAAQAELMRHAVELWKAAEMKKIDADPAAYIASAELPSGEQLGKADIASAELPSGEQLDKADQ